MSLKWVCDFCGSELDTHLLRRVTNGHDIVDDRAQLPDWWATVGGAHACSDDCAREIGREIRADNLMAARKDGTPWMI